MGLKVYYGAGSPYAWRVLLAVEHKQIAYELVTLSFAKREMHTPDYASINPREKVPAIADGDFTLYEAAAILEYLDERNPDAPPLFPADIHGRAIVRRLVHEIDVYVGQHISTLGGYVFRPAIPQEAEPFVERAARALREEIPRYEGWIRGPGLHGAVSAADFALYPMLAMIARLELRKPDLDLSSHIGPRVREWMKWIEALPYFDRTYPAHWR
jgi:glutathione S-transferase